MCRTVPLWTSDDGCGETCGREVDFKMSRSLLNRTPKRSSGNLDMMHFGWIFPKGFEGSLELSEMLLCLNLALETSFVFGALQILSLKDEQLERCRAEVIRQPTVKSPNCLEDFEHEDS